MDLEEEEREFNLVELVLNLEEETEWVLDLVEGYKELILVKGKRELILVEWELVLVELGRELILVEGK